MSEEMNATEALRAEIEKITAEVADLIGVEPKDLTETQLAKVQERASVRLHIRRQRNEERAQLDQLKLERDAAKAALISTQRLGVRDAISTKAPVSAERAKALVDDVTFFKMSEGQRIGLLGENADDVGNLKADASKYFGRGSDGRESLELSKSRPAYYARLREVAKILRVYGN